MQLDFLLHVEAQLVLDLGADPAPPGYAVNVCDEPCEHPRAPARVALMFRLPCLQNPLYRKREVLPVGGLRVQTTAARRCQFVDPGATVILRRRHL
jgi:hypothetical protein